MEMECAICYEKFFTPNSQEELKKIYNEHVKNNNYDEIMKFKNLLITPNHNNAHSCSTPNCACLICKNCWIKITYNGKVIYEMTEDDIPSIYDYFTCPYCMQIDWKDYMNNVFNELQQKVLGEEEFNKAFFKRCFPEFDN
jgi:hypothetical protein